MPKIREITNKIRDAVEEGLLTWQQVAQGALCYMSEDDVAQMAHNEDFFLYEEEEDEPFTMDELTEQAREIVEDHIDIIRETALPGEVGDQIYQLAYDSTIHNGAEESQARIIANYIRTQF